MQDKNVLFETLNDLWAVIPGFSSGTGADIAKALSRDLKINIIGIHRGNYPESAEEVQGCVINNGAKCEIITANGAKPENIDEITDNILKITGEQKVHMFVHSIADGSFGRFLCGTKYQLHFKQLNKTIENMANSFVYWTQHLVHKNMLAPQARLLGLTNTCGDNLIDGLGAITASKAALEIYVKHLAYELGPKGHKVNLLRFGLVETPAIQRAFDKEKWARVKKNTSFITPAKRLVTTPEVANFVSVLASSQGAWFNGATIDFSGGEVQSILSHVVHTY